MNIYSGSREGNGLAAALTNPTALARKKGTVQSDYPVTVMGRRFIDAEVAYQTLKRESSAKLDFATLQALMVYDVSPPAAAGRYLLLSQRGGQQCGGGPADPARVGRPGPLAAARCDDRDRPLVLGTPCASLCHHILAAGGE
jgi:hypothetical protein